MAGRAGHRLRDHAAVGQKYARGQISRFARRRAERSAHQRLRLLFDDGNQAVPHHLKLNVGELAHNCLLALRLSSTICPALLTDASKSAVTITVVWSSTIIAGPAMRAPGCSAVRSYIGTFRHCASFGSKRRRFESAVVFFAGNARAFAARLTVVETVTDQLM